MMEEVNPSTDKKIEPLHEVEVQPSPNGKTEPSAEEEVRPSLTVKNEPLLKPNGKIFIGFAKRVGECLCLNQN